MSDSVPTPIPRNLVCRLRKSWEEAHEFICWAINEAMKMRSLAPLFQPEPPAPVRRFSEVCRRLDVALDLFEELPLPRDSWLCLGGMRWDNKLGKEFPSTYGPDIASASMIPSDLILRRTPDGTDYMLDEANIRREIGEPISEHARTIQALLDDLERSTVPPPEDEVLILAREALETLSHKPKQCKLLEFIIGKYPSGAEMKDIAKAHFKGKFHAVDQRYAELRLSLANCGFEIDRQNNLLSLRLKAPRR